MRTSIEWALEYFKANKIETFLSFILLRLANVFQKTTIFQKYNEFITHVSNRNLEGAWRLVLFIMGTSTDESTRSMCDDASCDFLAKRYKADIAHRLTNRLGRCATCIL